MDSRIQRLYLYNMLDLALLPIYLVFPSVKKCLFDRDRIDILGGLSILVMSAAT